MLRAFAIESFIAVSSDILSSDVRYFDYSRVINERASAANDASSYVA